MKRATFVVLATAMLCLAGCVVTSVCPFYSQKDLVYEPALLGKWVNQQDAEQVWKFEKTAALEYRLDLVEGGKERIIEVRSFKLEGQLFLDLFSTEKDYHSIPPHYLLKVLQLTPALRMAQLDDGWIKEIIAKHPGALRHHLVRFGDKPEDTRIVLTGGTAELQQFVVKHLNNGLAWKADFELKPETSGANP